MASFEQFESDLQECLNHLYDPLYKPAGSMWDVIGIDPREGVGALQQSLIRIIREYGANSEAPPDTHLVQYQRLLSYRYVQWLTQEAAAERLGIATRSLRKQQTRAVRALASYLWESRLRSKPTAVQEDERIPATGSAAAASGPAPTRVDQLRKELASLRKESPSTQADVDATVRSTAALAQPLAAERGVDLRFHACGEQTPALIHPSALRQALLTAITELMGAVAGNALVLSTRRSGDDILITLEAEGADASASCDLSLVEEIIRAYGGSISSVTQANGLATEMRVPLVVQNHRARVAVIEDNAELVDFFRACAAGSYYDIVHIVDEHRALEIARECQPDAIVLDVMLPDSEIDGWELLIGLHAQSETRDTPVIVCSAIADENLALMLGAALYLPKPVRCQEFLDALGSLLNRGPTEERPAPASP